jgi:hypothetical protein
MAVSIMLSACGKNNVLMSNNEKTVEAFRDIGDRLEKLEETINYRFEIKNAKNNFLMFDAVIRNYPIIASMIFVALCGMYKIIFYHFNPSKAPANVGDIIALQRQIT